MRPYSPNNSHRENHITENSKNIAPPECHLTRVEVVLSPSVSTSSFPKLKTPLSSWSTASHALPYDATGCPKSPLTTQLTPLCSLPLKGTFRQRARKWPNLMRPPWENMTRTDHDQNIPITNSMTADMDDGCDPTAHTGAKCLLSLMILLALARSQQRLYDLWHPLRNYGIEVLLQGTDGYMQRRPLKLCTQRQQFYMSSQIPNHNTYLSITNAIILPKTSTTAPSWRPDPTPFTLSRASLTYWQRLRSRIIPWSRYATTLIREGGWDAPPRLYPLERRYPFGVSILGVKMEHSQPSQGNGDEDIHKDEDIHIDEDIHPIVAIRFPNESTRARFLLILYLIAIPLPDLSTFEGPNSSTAVLSTLSTRPNKPVQIAMHPTVPGTHRDRLYQFYVRELLQLTPIENQDEYLDAIQAVTAVQHAIEKGE